MRVLELVQQPAQRGAELFARQLSTEFRRRGVSTRTIYLYAETSGGRIELEPDDRVLAPAPRRTWERLAVDPRIFARLQAEVRDFAPNIVQLNGGRTVKYGALLGKVRRDAAFRTVYRNIGDPRAWIGNGAKRWLFSTIVFPAIDGVVCLTPETRDLLHREYGFRGPSTVIPSGISPDHLEAGRSRAETRRQLDTPESAVVIVSVGSLSREKRIDRLIEAVSSISRRNGGVFLWIAGAGPEQASLRRQVEQLGLQERVRWLGAYAPIGEVYRAADIFALTSDTEGMPAVVLEAAFCGLPVVATEVGAVRRCVVPDASAWLVARDDSATLVARLEALCNDAGLRTKMGERGRQLVMAEYLIGGIAEQYLAFFAQFA